MDEAAMGPVRIRPMTAGDIRQVAALEREAFAAEGVVTPFKRELANRVASYLVAYTDAGAGSEIEPAPGPARGLLLGRRPPRHTILGYAGLWFVVDEAHLTSIAVRRDRRRQGIGHRLLHASLELALQRDAKLMTLEVRVSNLGARSLYEKFGFKAVGVRRNYYTDNHEDAYLMTVEGIDVPAYRERLAALTAPDSV